MGELFKKYVLNGITQQDVDEAIKKMQPLALDEKTGVLHYGKNLPKDHFGESFTWAMQRGRKAVGLREFARVPTRHTYGYYGLFKPSLSEVITQIPPEMRNRVAGFYVEAPDNRKSGWLIDLLEDGTFSTNERPDGVEAENLHNTVTVLYEKVKGWKATRYRESEPTEEIVKYEVVKEQQRKDTDTRINGYIAETYALVEGNAHEPYFLFRQMGWDVDQIGTGTFLYCGKCADMEVVVSVFWLRVIGKDADGKPCNRLVGFWEPTSQVLDYRLIEKKLKAEFLQVQHRVNLDNIHNIGLIRSGCLPLHERISQVGCRHCGRYHCDDAETKRALEATKQSLEATKQTLEVQTRLVAEFRATLAAKGG